MRAPTGRVLVLGDVFCDIIMRGTHGLPRWGEEVFAEEPVLCPGGVATVAIGLARLGSDATLLGRTRARDTISRVLAEELARVDRLEVRWLLDGPSTAITVAVREASERALISYAPPTEVGLVAPAVPWDEITDAAHLHVGTWQEQGRPLADQCAVLKAARERNVTTSLDTSLGRGEDAATRVRNLLAHVDLFLPNGAEACWLAGTDDVTTALGRLAEIVPTVVVTCGPDGAMAASGGHVVRVPGLDARVVDTTGAGDAFTAGFLHGFVRRWRLERSLELANVCGALSVAGLGSSTAVPDARRAFGALERSTAAGAAGPAPPSDPFPAPSHRTEESP